MKKASPRGIHLAGWELMEDPGFEPPMPSPEHSRKSKPTQHFQKTFADTYFKTISDSLKWHAPNQLLLGGRCREYAGKPWPLCAVLRRAELQHVHAQASGRL